MKGISFISGVIFMAFLFTAITIVYVTTAPVIEKMQCAATVDRMKSLFIQLDRLIQEVASGGQGSKRTANINIDSGRIYFSKQSNTTYWEGECESPIISPRTFQKIGNLVFGSYLETKAYEGNCDFIDQSNAYILENEHIIACFKKIGSENNLVPCNTSDVLLGVYNKDLSEKMPLEKLEISLAGNESSKTGVCYTKIAKKGYHLPYGDVILYIESGYINYYVHFILESGADFLIIRGES